MLTIASVFEDMQRKIATKTSRKMNFYVFRPQQRNLFRKNKSYARSPSCKIANYL
jgi:hypothetical protein